MFPRPTALDLGELVTPTVNGNSRSQLQERDLESRAMALEQKHGGCAAILMVALGTGFVIVSGQVRDVSF